MSSPPAAAAYVPYQAYKSKRHSRNFSSQPLSPNVSPPPVSRPPSVIINGSPAGIHLPPGSETPPELPPDSEKWQVNGQTSNESISSITSIKMEEPPAITEISVAAKQSKRSPSPRVQSPPVASPISPPHICPAEQTEPALQAPTPIPAVGSSLINGGSGSPRDAPVAGPSSAPVNAANEEVKPSPVSRKSSTFRHIPLRGTPRSTHPSSPLRAMSLSLRGMPASPSRSPASNPSHVLPHGDLRDRSSFRSPILGPRSGSALPAIPTSNGIADERQRGTHEKSQSVDSGAPRLLSPSAAPPTVSSQSPSLPPPPPLKTVPLSSRNSSTPSTPPASSPATPLPSLPSHSTAVHRASTPYRPGFQPKGVSGIRTEEFTFSRNLKRDIGRIERTKLERRLEKLINLHFSPEGRTRPDSLRLAGNRRASSFFDLDFSDIRGVGAGELWRGVVQSQALQGTKGDIRAAEQRITPWEDDVTVAKCPYCSTSFHPLTNRKHHCRLCGKIVCSLPVKLPQRPVPCSLLFVVDPQTRQIEEVSEGVDYGVRKRKGSIAQGAGNTKEETLGDDEKFLKGVRICKACRPILRRQQYQQEASKVPAFARLYEALLALEKEIEEALPQFQELLLTLSHDDQPTKEASAARKRLLDAFAQYDSISKRIRKLPCPTGSSQDRVQQAITTRANIFLQQNMFPLQSLPKPPSKTSQTSPSKEQISTVDPDSQIAHALQPLLEQEALLESFVEEAIAQRKFEDVKTLKANLSEIRREIEKIVANAEGLDLSKEGVKR